MIGEMRTILFGDFEFGDLSVGRDSFSVAIIHKIDDVRVMEEEGADDFMVKNHYSGYLIPAIFDGEILYSERGVKNESK